MVIAYAIFALISGALAWRLGAHPPLAHADPWIGRGPVVAASSSAMLGIAYAFVIVLGTRASVARFAWARQLHHELSPVARRLSTGGIVVVALLSALGEELFFRGFLLENIGILASTAIFGVIHQTRGTSQWTWALWATAVGLGFALLYVATGSLVGPILAHALINGTNLAFLRSHEVQLVDATPTPAPAASVAENEARAET